MTLSVQFSRSVVSDSFRPHESQHARPPCPSPTPREFTQTQTQFASSVLSYILKFQKLKPDLHAPADVFKDTVAWRHLDVSTDLCVLVVQSCPTLCDPMDCSPPGSSVRGDSPSKNTGMGCHSLLQRVFSSQGSNPGLSQCRQILYHLSHQGSPGSLWVTINNDRG